jgi:CrcB protein
MAVAVLGGAGALARFVLDALVSQQLGAAFPWGTLVVNVSGTFLLGLSIGLAVHGDALVLAGTATLGSYTTFSTWMLESHRLGEEGQAAGGWINVAISLLVGVGAAALGRAIGGAL